MIYSLARSEVSFKSNFSQKKVKIIFLGQDVLITNHKSHPNTSPNLKIKNAQMKIPRFVSFSLA